MKLPTLKNGIWIVLLNLIIAFGFYFDNVDSGYSVLASDVHSIVPIAQKFDNPELFKDDLYLNTLDNVRYYTPFFVQPLRFLAKFTQLDYLQALNVFGLIAHFFYGIFWFLLFYKFSNRIWVALIMSILIRGLVWLPGNEIWGIADLWSIMPRTIYITLMPLPFLFLSGSKKIGLYLSAFLIGFVFNFHPITGLGGILIYVSLLFLIYYYSRDNVKFSLNVLPLVFGLIILGMLPFIITYFSKTEVSADYDVNLYKEAFTKRIPSSFESPFIFLKQWFAAKTLFFLIPLLLLVFISLKNSAELKKAKILLILTVLIVFFSSISTYIEGFVNRIFDLNLRMSFQFIRLQKLAILPAYFAMAFLLCKIKTSKSILPGVFIAFLIMLISSKSKSFNTFPLIGDDIFRAILPESLSLWPDKKERYNSTDKMMDYIASNTEINDVFRGPPIIRCAAKRSVVMDYKGSSAIIEGNPKQFIQWYKDRAEYVKLKTQEERLQFLRSTKNVDYIVTKGDLKKNATLVHEVNELRLYRLHD